MNSKRLQFLAILIDPKARVIDIGTDHAYLPILLYQKNQQKILATDIHPKALDAAKKSLKDYHLEKNIDLCLTDGLKTIDTKKYDTLVIAGMGTHTITKILMDEKPLEPIKTIYLQTNNDYGLLRKFMNQKGWMLQHEYILEENQQIYHIMEYIKGKEELSETEILFGKYQFEHKKYYQRELDHLDALLQQIPDSKRQLREDLQEQQTLLKAYLR